MAKKAGDSIVTSTYRQEAERFLRDRLDARDEGLLTIVLDSKRLMFSQWADWFWSGAPNRHLGAREIISRI
jgi:hypothetical protein